MSERENKRDGGRWLEREREREGERERESDVFSRSYRVQ